MKTKLAILLLMVLFASCSNETMQPAATQETDLPPCRYELPVYSKNTWLGSVEITPSANGITVQILGLDIQPTSLKIRATTSPISVNQLGHWFNQSIPSLPFTAFYSWRDLGIANPSVNFYLYVRFETATGIAWAGDISGVRPFHKYANIIKCQ